MTVFKLYEGAWSEMHTGRHVYQVPVALCTRRNLFSLGQYKRPFSGGHRRSLLLLQSARRKGKVP